MFMLAFSGVSIISLYFLRKWLAGGTCHCKGQLKGKTVVITGGNAGIGKETVRLLAEKGARVIMACRNMDSANDAIKEIKASTKNESIVAMKLDLASFNSIRNFATEFLKNEPRLDILINNAGIYYYPHVVSEDGNDLVYQTNYLGHFLLTMLLLDRIKSSSPSRIINVSSIAHMNCPKDDYLVDSDKESSRDLMYAKSKLAQILFTKSLAHQLKDSGVTVNSLHPGVVDTTIFKNLILLRNPLGRFTFWLVCKLIFKTPRQGAQTTIHCAVSTECETLTGLYFKDCVPYPLESYATDDQLADTLWNKSLQLTHVKQS